MSIPSSKILKASKSIMAIADLKHNSPQSAQSQSVNIVVNATPEKAVAYPKFDREIPQPKEEKTIEPNPYEEQQTRDIEEAMKKTEEITESIEEKDNTIKALSLIIEIIRNNPLIINKFVVAEQETLAELIRLITNSESVEIDTNDIECSCSSPKYKVVKRIYIKKEGIVYTLSQCPIILRLFDNYKISLNCVI